MKVIKALLKELQKNHYVDFIIEPYSELVDFTEHEVLIEYDRKNYYEMRLNSIVTRQNEVIKNVRELFNKALSELFIKLANTDSKNLNSLITFYIEAINLNLKTLKLDFYIDDQKSRYFSTIIDCKEVQTLHKSLIKDDPNNYAIDGKFFKMIEKTFGDYKYETEEPIPNIYYLGFLEKRFKVLSRLPFYLFHISIKLVNELQRAKVLIQMEEEAKQSLSKIKWTGNKTQIGFILGSLALEGYIQAPESTNGEINYTAFARLIKQVFDVEVTPDSLRKYLNPTDEKFNESKSNFEGKGFNLPNKKIVS